MTTAISIPMDRLPLFEPNTEAYDLLCRSLALGSAPVGCMMCEVRPGQQSRVHNHFESEAFIFLHGNGIFVSDGRETEVGPGQAIIAEPFSNHVVRNDSTSTSLYFVSVYWDGKTPEQKESDTRNALVFSTPPTPNGDLHLGHLSGPYLAADVYRRHVERQGAGTLHITGRDDHQTYVTRKALSSGRAPIEVATDYATQIRHTLAASNIAIDYFIEPDANGPYARFVVSVFSKLCELGLIVAKEEPAFFDASSGRYLHEAFISGECPHCGHGSDGNACEHCGRPNQCVDLRQPVSLFGDAAPRSKAFRRLYFRFSAFEKRLADYVNSTPMSAHALALSSLMLRDGLPDICVSHPTELGIDVPVEGFAGQKIYVWFEMAAGYLWAAGHESGPDTLAVLGRAAAIYGDENQDVVHFYGFDNTYYHTLLFPAVYFALGIRPPSAHVVNELLDLDNKKFSTSRGHLIWGRDLLSRVPIDYARWAMCAARPEGSRSNFSIESFCKELNQHFPETLKDWTDGLADLVVTCFDGAVPEAGAWTAEHRAFYADVQDFHATTQKLFQIDRFSPRSVVTALRAFALQARRFQDAQAAMREIAPLRDFLRTTAALSALALRSYAIHVLPVTPAFAAALMQFIGLAPASVGSEIQFVRPGTRLAPSAIPLWPRLEASELADLPARGRGHSPARKEDQGAL